jgi:hypothetical protein
MQLLKVKTWSIVPMTLQTHFVQAVILSDCKGAKNLRCVEGSAVHRQDSSSLRSSE